jgi:hypothetical protein
MRYIAGAEHSSVYRELRMSSSVWPDLSCLASLSRDQNLDMRPVLLRVHTDFFVAAPARDRTTIKAFEALALGFLPRVDDATATVVAKKLAPIADTPQAVVEALIRRGGETARAILDSGKPIRTPPEHQHEAPPAVPGSSATPEPPADPLEQLARRNDALDLALARDRDVRLGRPVLQELVDRGRDRPDLARALLTRTELSTLDEAILYLHADEPRREQIRSKLEPLTAFTDSGLATRHADQDAVDALLGFASAGDTSAFGEQLATMIGLAVVPAWLFHVETRRELLALALVAAGVADEDRIRILLTLSPEIAHSVRWVFRLTELARTVRPAVAVHLLEAVMGITIDNRRIRRHMPAMHASGSPARAVPFSRLLPGKRWDGERRRDAG